MNARYFGAILVALLLCVMVAMKVMPVWAFAAMLAFLVIACVRRP